jgi:hypothetical protein
VTEQQAEEVVMLIAAATGGPPPDDQKLAFFTAALLHLEYPIALSTATTGSVIWRYFPSWAEFKEIYRTQQKLTEPLGEQRDQLAEPLPPIARGRKIPDWVRRWVAARFLYARFGRSQDLRFFPEQKDFIDATQMERMPDSEWIEEAAKISDEDVWKAVAQ